jgi:hypothetical protein
MINNPHKIWITEDQIDNSFDHEFYASEYPDTLSYCKYLSNTSLKERLYNHYYKFGKKENRFKNIEEKGIKDIDNTSLLSHMSLTEMNFASNKLECICLLLTTKEILDGSYNSLINRIKENTRPEEARDIAFTILLNQETETSRLQIHILDSIFNNIDIINLKLSPEQDLYIKDSELILDKIPEYGTKSGPNIMFFKAIELCQKYNTTLLLETDCFFKNDWLDKLKSFVLNSNSFWISGSIYDGIIPCKASSYMMTHINGGTALYATGNHNLQAFINFAKIFILKKIQDGMPDLAYDYGIKIFIDNNINSHIDKPEDILLWKFINRNYLPNKLIGNFSTSVDQHLSIEQIQRLYNYYIIHKK